MMGVAVASQRVSHDHRDALSAAGIIGSAIRTATSIETEQRTA
jgi:hypothetical protein